jgi:hypothetical protein
VLGLISRLTLDALRPGMAVIRLTVVLLPASKRMAPAFLPADMRIHP